MKERARKINQRSDVSNVKSCVIMQTIARMIKKQVEMKKHVTFAMMCCENIEEEKYEMGKKKMSKNQRILMMMKEK